MPRPGHAFPTYIIDPSMRKVYYRREISPSSVPKPLHRLTSLTQTPSGSPKFTAILAVDPSTNLKISLRITSPLAPSFSVAASTLYFVKTVANTAVNSTCANSSASISN
jgi:hypothetical protein